MQVSNTAEVIKYVAGQTLSRVFALGLGDGASHEGPSFLPSRRIERGDVVIFRPPVTPITDETTDYIKRIIGLPGDRLVLTYDEARDGVRVNVNGQDLPESFRLGHFATPHEEVGSEWTVTFEGEPPELRRDGSPRYFTLGADEFFAMGDNRNDSADSRFWGGSYAVKGERIRGLAWFVYWSYDVRDNNPEPTGLVPRLRQYVRIALTFVTRTRWERTLLPIR